MPSPTFPLSLQIFGLCGVNGAGKTSTFKMLTGELIPSEGDAQLNNVDITKSSSRRRVGYCPQVNSLDTLLTARQILNVYAQLKGVDNIEQVRTMSLLCQFWIMLSQQSVKCENLFAISAISKPITSTKDSRTKSSISPQNVTIAY